MMNLKFNIINSYGILIDLASLFKINFMKLFFAALMLIVFSATAYSQNNIEIKLKCGETSPTSPAPLWIMVFKNKTFIIKNEYTKAINPNTIESVNVTKDAAAAAIYGIRGAHGVITIIIRDKFKKKEFKRLKPYLEKP